MPGSCFSFNDMEVLKWYVCFILLAQLPGIHSQECGVAPINTKIVGGVDAIPGSWPWQVSIHIIVVDAHNCGGTVINTDWVLTAAHCIIATTGPSDYLLYFGRQTQNGSNPNEVNRTVSQIIVHPDYNGTTFSNDIALMKLSSPITYSNYIRPVCLASNTSIFNNGTNCWATGWGRLSGTAPLVAHDILQEVEVPIIGNNMCGCIYSYYTTNTILSNMICAGEKGKGICQGDSGGPVQCKQGSQWIQAGVSSFGIPCAIGIPEVFARVSYYNSWIISNTAGSNVSFVEYNSTGTDPDSSFVCPANGTTSSNSTTNPCGRVIPSELTFAGTVMMILLMPFFA